MGTAPVPESATVLAPPKALCTMLRVADRTPEAAGLKVTPIDALVPGAMVSGSGLPEFTANSLAFVPVSIRAETISGALPVLLKVTCCAGLVV